MAETRPAADPTPEIPRQENYPPYVVTESDKRRWDACAAVAKQVMGDLGGEHEWLTTRQLYQSDIPTDGPFPGNPSEA